MMNMNDGDSRRSTVLFQGAGTAANFGRIQLPKLVQHAATPELQRLAAQEDLPRGVYPLGRGGRKWNCCLRLIMTTGNRLWE
jgi:hypothetical protein